MGKEHQASFKDNDGFIFENFGKLLRQVNKSYKADYDQLISSGLYKELVNQGLLVPHKEVDLEQALTKEAYKVLEPQPLDFISYPYEWCFSQLKEAALTTLKIQNIALKFDMSLKDANAFNIQFYKGKAIMIDTLSFEKFQPKPWVAYRQFCQHFLNPLVLMSKLDPSLNKLLAIYLDGISVELTSKLLPFYTKFYPSIFIHIQLHSLLDHRQTSPKKVNSLSKKSSFTKKSILGLVDSLEGAVIRLKLRKMNDSFWSNYVPESDSYTKEAFAQKQKIIREFLKQIKPQTVWDLGSNSGLFSRLAGDLGAEVVSFDIDPLSVEKNFYLSKGKNNILPLVVDWTNPSPSLGWADKERVSILDRGPVNLIMALALIHHLVIGSNIPQEKVAELFSKISKYLIIEFVPKDDPQVKELLSLREDIFKDYDNEGFERSFGKYFKIITSTTIKGSKRQLYLMETIS